MIATVGLILGTVTAANAEAGSRLAIGGVLNFATFDTSGNEVGTRAGANASATHSNDVDFASLFIEGVAKTEGNLGLTLGVEVIPGEASLGSKTRADTGGRTAAEGDTKTYKAEAKVSEHVSLYVEPTFYFNDMVGFYVKGGGVSVLVKTLEDLIIGTDDSTYGHERIFGTVVGAGFRVTHSSGLFLKAEYSETDYGEVVFTSSTGNKNKITANPDQDAVRVSLGFQF